MPKGVYPRKSNKKESESMKERANHAERQRDEHIKDKHRILQDYETKVQALYAEIQRKDRLINILLDKIEED